MRKNEIRINEIKKLRIGEIGRVNINDNQAKNLVKEKKELERLNRKLRQENRDLKTKIKVYEKMYS